jgi:predicted metal-binding protein
MGMGACTRCGQCTYPDQPCRFPELAYPSMEAYGLVVSEVCKRNGAPYYNGPDTVTFSSCMLVE